MRSGVLLVAAALIASASTDAAQYIAAAQRAIESHDLTTAKRQLALAVQANPDSAQAWLMLATIEAQTGEPDALAHCLHAVRLAPNSFAGHYNLALLYLREHQLDAARSHLEKAAALDPKQPDAAYNLAMVLLESNQPGEAVRMLRRARSLQPERGDVAFNLVRAEISCSDLKAARAEVDQMRDAPGLQPSAQDARRLLATAYLKAGQPHQVPELIRSAGSAEDHFLLASAFFAQRQFSEASREADSAVEMQPNEPRYVLLAARVEQSLGRHQRALALLRRASEIAPDLPNISYSEAVSYYFEKRYQDCRRSLDRALRLSPECSHCLFLYGVTLVNEGQNTEAISYLRQAANAAPRNARYHFHLGTALARGNQYSDAKIEFADTIRLSTKYALAHYELGKLLAREGNSPAAIAEYEAAIQADQSLAQAYYQLGREALNAGQPQKSEWALARFRDLKQRQDEDQDRAEDIVGELRER